MVARVDWGRAYEQLSSHARRGYLVLVDDLFKLSERLVEDKVIAIDVVQGLAAEDGVAPVEDATATALEWIQRMLIERFCEPVLALDREPARASLGALGELAGVGAAFEVRALAQVERSVATVDLQRPAVVVRTLTVQAHLGDLLGGAAARRAHRRRGPRSPLLPEGLAAPPQRAIAERVVGARGDRRLVVRRDARDAAPHAGAGR